MPTVAGLTVYPVKGMAGVSVSTWPVEARGLLHDRRWMLVDETGGFISQRTHPILCRFKPVLDDEGLTICAPYGSVRAPLCPPSEAERIEVTIWKDRTYGVPICPEVDAWFSEHLGTAVRLVYMPDDVMRPANPEYSRDGDHVGFADAFPVLVASQASLEDLNRRLATPLPMNRFRANILVAGTEPFAEDTWPSMSIGAVAFRAAKLCARCLVTATNQETAEVGQEPLRTLATFRQKDNKGYFGAYFIPECGGAISVGDALVMRN